MSGKVFVTGASGFIGRWSIGALKELGYEVHALTGPGYPMPLGVKPDQVHEVDLMEPSQVRALLCRERPSHLLHFAWYTAHGKFWESLENLKWVSASLHLLEAFSENGGRRVVFAGTCAEYAWGETVLSEDSTPLLPSTLYGECKNSLQKIYFRAVQKMGLSAAWGRIFFLYGPHEAPARFVPAVITSLLKGVPAELTHGRQIRDFMHSEDVARSFAVLLNSEFVGPMNLASGVPVSLGEVAEKIGQMLGRSDLIRLGAKEAAAGEPARIVADTRRLKDLGFRAKFTLESGLENTLQWWRQAQPL